MRVFTENYLNYLRNNMERKPYYITRLHNSLFALKEGTPFSYRTGGGTSIQLYLTDEEVQKWNTKKMREMAKPYEKILDKRTMYIPVELQLYIICEVLYA